MDSIRQQKICSLIKKEISIIISNMSGNSGLVITTTKVSISSDLHVSKIYFSVFPSNSGEKFLKELNLFRNQIKHKLAQKIKNQVRIIPELLFFIDDSLDYIENIENILKSPDNPIK